MGQKLIERFLKYIAHNSLFDKEDKILLAVSGGVDSMVMMDLFAKTGYDFAVAHCNFQLRGQEAYEDEVLVEQAAQSSGVPFYNMRFDTAGEMERTGESVQLAARRLRYAWFDRLCAEHGYNVIAVAHHADDSVETFFINLFRGTGLRGLTGIGVINGRVVRPMLFATRKEVLDYAGANKVAFREDSSNRSTKYLRNKIRLGIIPRLKEISPMFAEIMSMNVKRLTDAQVFITEAVKLIRSEVETETDGIVTMDISRINDSFPKDFVIYELLVKYGFKGDVVDDLCRTLESGVSGKRFYSKDYVAYTDRSTIKVTLLNDEDLCTVAVNTDTRRVYCGNSVIYFQKIDIDNIDTLIQPESIALIDADKLAYPLELRKWHDGDSFVPFGMQGRKKISDYLIDAKVSVPDKKRQFVLVSQGEIVWLVGRRIDDRYKVGKGTENVLKIIKDTI